MEKFFKVGMLMEKFFSSHEYLIIVSTMENEKKEKLTSPPTPDMAHTSKVSICHIERRRTK
jgi:hypothetical protein